MPLFAKNSHFVLVFALVLSFLTPFCVKSAEIERSKLVADFEKASVNNLGGLIVAHATDHCSVKNGLIETKRGGRPGHAETVIFEVQNSGWAAWWTYLTPSEGGFNAGDYEELAFWLRGDVGGEPLELGLVDTEDRSVWLSLRRVLPRRASKRWQFVRVPLRLFDLKAIDPRSIKNITIRSTRLGRTAFYLDDLQLYTPAEDNPWEPKGFSAVLEMEPHPGYPPTPEGWMLGQLGTQGFLDSTDDDTPNAFAYDQALGVIAFAASGRKAEATRILAALEKVQNDDGSFVSCYHAGTGRVLNDALYAGNNAWIVMAVNFYTMKTGDRRFLKMARRCADWLLQFQHPQSGGIRGGPNVKWYSTEHNADAFSAFRHLAILTKDQKYAQAAKRVRAFIERELYVPSPASGGHRKDRPAFWTGQGDTAVLGSDPQAWTTLALCGTDYPEKNLKAVMKWLLESNCRKKKDWDTSIREIDGFDWDELERFHNIPATSVNETKFPSGNVWFEGTEGAVAALRCLGMDRQADHFHRQTARVISRSGGIPYCTPHPDLFHRASPELSVAATAWYMFNELEVNPFDSQ